VGANNLRKGWQEVREAWCRGGFDTRTDCELYLKTLGPRGMKSQVGRNTWVDDRLLTDAQLMLLYADADGFLFPSYGEGFGLTLLEAMATALPCIATLHTGMTEYADETVCRKVMTEPTTVCMDEAGYDTHYETVLRANVPDLVAQIAETMAHWTRAKRMGVRAWRRAQSFSWAAAGRRLVDVLATHSPADRRGGVSNAVSDPTGPDRCQVPAGR
jgi:glycosyltransferase involved in cell wall biosynthesis